MSQSHHTKFCENRSADSEVEMGVAVWGTKHGDLTSLIFLPFLIMKICYKQQQGKLSFRQIHGGLKVSFSAQDSVPLSRTCF